MKKISLALIMLSSASVLMANPLGKTLFSIAPSTTSITVASNAETSVVYTLTNNSSATIPAIATQYITPGYNSSGSGLSVMDNTCSSALPPITGHCTFRVLIPAGQASSFVMAPKVCGFNGSLCSFSANPVAVTVNNVSSLTTRAYEEITPIPEIGKLGIGENYLIGINVNNTANIIHAATNPLSGNAGSSGVVISPDGSKVYATDYDATNGLSVEVYDVTSTALVPFTNIPVATAGQCNYYAAEMAGTPDGSKLFVTVHEGSCESKNHALRSVDTSTIFSINTATHVSTTLSSLRDQTDPAGVVVSPDGQTVYVGLFGTNIIAFPSSATASTTGTLIPGVGNSWHSGLAMDPAGGTLYVGNDALGTVSVIPINGTTLTGEITTLTVASNNPNLGGVVISADGKTAFISNTVANTVTAVPVAGVGNLVQTSAAGTFGLALTPDGSALYAPGSYPGGYTSVMNATDLSLTEIALPGKSHTIGQFIGP